MDQSTLARDLLIHNNKIIEFRKGNSLSLRESESLLHKNWQYEIELNKRMHLIKTELSELVKNDEHIWTSISNLLTPCWQFG